MSEKNKKRNTAAISLTLCFCVVALTSIMAVQGAINKVKDAAESGVNVPESTVSESSTASAGTPVVDSRESEAAASPYIMPLDGEVQLEFAMDSLVYSKTLDQYMTHPGADISARPGTQVKAIAAGTVSSVYEDDRYGMTVEISHGDDIVSRYSNLEEERQVEAGDTVEQGQVIGLVGDTALFENLEETHLHLEITKDGELTDPYKFIKDGK